MNKVEFINTHVWKIAQLDEDSGRFNWPTEGLKKHSYWLSFFFFYLNYLQLCTSKDVFLLFFCAKNQ